VVAAWLGLSCGGGGDHPGPPRIYPPRTYVLPGRSAAYEVRGSTSTYEWSIQYDRSVGAAIDSAGVYTAGGAPNNCDVVRAALPSGEALNATAHVTLTPLDPLILDEDYLYVVTGGNHKFSVSGGTGPYFWTMRTNVSGGVLEDTGMYHAGQNPGIDVLQVDDSAGQATQATVTVSPQPDDSCKGGCCGCGGTGGSSSALAVVLVLLLRRRCAPARRP
jgi:hypothetical protein